MLIDLLEGLTPDQKRELEELGITRQRRHDWKVGPRKPTAAQCLVLAMVTNSDPKPLLQWLAEQEASEAQLAYFRKVKETGSWAFLSAVFAVILATPDPVFAQCSSSQTQFDPLKSGNAHCRLL